MKYEALFGIDCGISQGFGVKYPDYVEIREEIAAGSPADAMREAVSRARYHSRNYLSNPETGKTLVTLKSVIDNDGCALDQESLIPETEKPRMTDDGCCIFECSMLEHILLCMRHNC